jgi:hypothetical protein
MNQGIVAYHQDDEGHWVAELVCGHFQHVRHDPPMVSRPWVLTIEGRDEMLGYELECKKYDVVRLKIKNKMVVPYLDYFMAVCLYRYVIFINIF